MSKVKQRIQIKGWEIGAIASVLAMIASVRGWSTTIVVNQHDLSRTLSSINSGISNINIALQAHLDDVELGKQDMERFSVAVKLGFARLGVNFKDLSE